MKLLQHTLLCIIILSPLSTLADDNIKPYFAGDSISPTLLSPPFAVKSAEQKKDLDYIIKLQKKATKEELEKAEFERNMKVEMVAEAVVPLLTRASYPAVYALLDRVGKTSHKVTDFAKNYYNTQRPYIVDSRVKALIEAHNNPAYPSGHTSGSYTWAHVMNLLLPEYKADFYKKAESIANHRALVGMHFPNDLDGGRQLALLTIGSLLQNKEFQSDLAKAQKELKTKPITR